MDPRLNIAIDAARKAGSLIARAIDRIDRVIVTEKSPNNFVTDVDMQAEQLIIRTLQDAYPNYGFLAEESGEQNSEAGIWIIDPLDGTTNFIHGIPHVGVSIALQEQGKLILAVIYDPIRNELFTAARGKGAQLNGKRMRVSQQLELDGALLGTGFPHRDKTHWAVYADTFAELFEKSAGIRRPGAAVLDLAYVACGRFDGFWELGLSPWDLAAGVLLIREAGGLVGDFEGGENYLNTGNIVAANPKLFRQMLHIIKPRLNGITN